MRRFARERGPLEVRVRVGDEPEQPDRRQEEDRHGRDEHADEREDRGHDKRAILRGVVLFLSIAIPIGFIAYVDHVRKQVGVNWLGALGALVALSLVIATAVVSSRK